MSYYKYKHMMNIELGRLIAAAKNGGKVLNYYSILLSLTEKFPVSDLSVKKRLEYLEKIGAIKIDGDEIITKNE